MQIDKRNAKPQTLKHFFEQLHNSSIQCDISSVTNKTEQLVISRSDLLENHQACGS